MYYAPPIVYGAQYQTTIYQQQQPQPLPQSTYSNPPPSFYNQNQNQNQNKTNYNQNNPPSIYNQNQNQNQNKTNYNQCGNPPSIYNQNQNQNQNKTNYNQTNPPNIYNNNQNKNQNQNQNFGPSAFISGRIGKMQISSEDKDSFTKSLQSAEWTRNQNYIQTKNMKVNMKIGFQTQLKSEIKQPTCRFDQYFYNPTFNENECQDFINNTQNENKNKIEEFKKEKEEFIKVHFPNENVDMPETELYKKIGENKKDILMKDSKVYQKVERFLDLNEPPAAPPRQNSGNIYGYARNNGQPNMGY